MAEWIYAPARIDSRLAREVGLRPSPRLCSGLSGDSIAVACGGFSTDAGHPEVPSSENDVLTAAGTRSPQSTMSSGTFRAFAPSLSLDLDFGPGLAGHRSPFKRSTRRPS